MTAAHATLRQRASRLVANADVEPDTLASAAILVVRSLQDPLPRELPVSTPTAYTPPRWERAMKASLTEMQQRAARMSDGTVPPNAPAVLFQDPAEMLAAFARDVCARTAVSQWWWHALLRGLPGGLSVHTMHALWLREARHVPAAVALLHAAGDAGRVLMLLTKAQTMQLLGAVAYAYNVPAILETAAAPPVPIAVRPAAATGVNVPTGRMRAAQPPWEHIFGTLIVAHDVPPEHEALLGLCLTVYHAPLVARTTSFARAFQLWRAEAAAHYAADAITSSLAPRALPGGVQEMEDSSPEGTSFGKEAAPHDGAGPAARTHAVLTAGARSPDPVSAQPADVLPHSSHDAMRVRPRASYSVQRDDTGPSPALDSVAPLDARVRPLIDVHSTLCGAFFLINALRAVSWFDEARVHFAQLATGWAWLDHVTRALLPDHHRSEDPIWRVLAALDGREHPLHTSPAIRNYLDIALPPLYERLLAVMRHARDEDPLHAAVLERAGRIECTRTHVDVHMRMEDVTLAVRMSGLDANPGWVPELARVVTFHFT